MKTRLVISIGFLLLVSAISLQAQNALPDPHNDACWQSLESLRACQLEQYNREIDYAQRCTSYPEYQCTPPTADKTTAEGSGKGASTSGKVRVNASEKLSSAPSTQSRSVSAQAADSN
jgi:hypothetical protein